MRAAFALALVLSALVACAGAGPRAELPQLSVRAGSAALLAAVERNAAAQDWIVVRRDTVAGVLEAVTAPKRILGVANRQHWVFVVSPSGVDASVFFEAQLDRGRWARSLGVGSALADERERAELERIASHVTVAPATVVAASW